MLFQSVLQDNLPSQNLIVEDVSDAPPENLNPEAPLSSNMATPTSHMASTLSNVASALSYMASVSSDMPSASSHMASSSSGMASSSSGMASSSSGMASSSFDMASAFSYMSSASSHMASASSGMTSAASDAKDRGTDSQESQEEHLLRLLQEKMQEVESLKKALERVNKENMLLATFLRSEKCLEESSTSQKEQEPIDDAKMEK